MRAESGLKAYAEQVNLRLESLLPPGVEIPTPLHEAMRYSTLAPGKRLRPALCMASAVAAGGKAEEALDAGCSVELVHCFSLIHDDLPSIDNDDLRRGRPTCHKAFGEAIALLAGDALFSLAFEVLASLPITADRISAAVRELAKATGTNGLVGGEALDILSEGAEPDASLLAGIHRKKTGVLFAASCAIGAITGGGDARHIDALREYGASVGLAFQIADDILNETSTPEQLGKAVGSDLARKKLTYPALYGLEGSQVKAIEARDRALSSLAGLKGETSMLEALAEFSIGRAS